MERRLAAIFALDMVGYSRLMEGDEAGTLSRQKAYRTDLIDPAVERHHGRIVKEMGDGLLLEFPSAVEAVECAAEIQRAMPELEKDVAFDRRIAFRIGINVGDIVAEDGDIYGDGVNVAARIESIADIGGVFISGSAFNQVKNKVELGFEDLGPHSVKNIEEPVHVYRVLLDPEAAGSIPGQRKKSGLKHQLLRRRVPQFVSLFLVGSWAFLEFISFAVEQYGLSPVLPTFVLSLLLLLLPTVLWLAWHHGARGPDGWTRADGIFLTGNVVLAAAVLFGPAGMLVGDLTTTNLERREARATRESALESLEATEDPRRIAVLYFEPRGTEEEVPYLAAGLTEALIDELSLVRQLHVVSSNGVAPYRNQVVSPDSIGRALKVGTLVSGSVALTGDRIDVRVTFVNTTTGAQFGSRSVEKERAELFALQDSLAAEVADFLREMLGEEIELIVRQAGTESVEAWELMQRSSDLEDQAALFYDEEGTEAAMERIASADSLLAEAEEVAPEWVEPTIQRGWLAFQRSRWTGFDDRSAADEWIGVGMEHAQVALQLDPDQPDALELRGILQYWKYLLNLAGGPEELDRLVGDAETDFMASVTANPQQASAWNYLSHLLASQDRLAEAKNAARRSYETDPYLRNAHLTLWRLFFTSFDLGDGVEARRWCGEGRGRFPELERFAQCGIMNYSLPDAAPDIPRTWALYEEYVELSPSSDREFNRHKGQMLVAMALARAGLADSARAVAERARAGPEIDGTREIPYWESAVRSMLGDIDEGLEQLSIHVAANPGYGLGGDEPWYRQELEKDPRYAIVVAVE